MEQITAAAKLFSHICMGSMILSCFDPSLMTWLGNFLHHSVAGYANLPDAVNAFTGAAAPVTAAPAIMHHMPGMDM